MPFRNLAMAIGLTGKMTATAEGEVFKQRVKPILKKLGAFPHKKLDASIGAKKQTTRMLKVQCREFMCGMVFRTSAKWATSAELHCPACDGAVDIG